jgi:hypothetical protein
VTQRSWTRGERQPHCGDQQAVLMINSSNFCDHQAYVAHRGDHHASSAVSRFEHNSSGLLIKVWASAGSRVDLPPSDVQR